MQQQTSTEYESSAPPPVSHAPLVGSVTCRGQEARRGKKGTARPKTNQDCGCAFFPFGSAMALFGICDGHGAEGDWCAQHATRTIVAKLADHPQLDQSPGDALRDSLIAANAALCADAAAGLSGSTALWALAVRGAGAADETVLWVAHVGDSRAVLGSADGALELTRDHNPDLPTERERIERCGGVVSAAVPSRDEPARVWLDGTKTAPGIAMSRSLGDASAKRVGVVAEPDVSSHVLDPERHSFLLLASDGLWERVSSESACSIARTALSAPAAAFDGASVDATATVASRLLISHAKREWRAHAGDRRDDITVITVRVPALCDALRRGVPAAPAPSAAPPLAPANSGTAARETADTPPAISPRPAPATAAFASSPGDLLPAPVGVSSAGCCGLGYSSCGGTQPAQTEQGCEGAAASSGPGRDTTLSTGATATFGSDGDLYDDRLQPSFADQSEVTEADGSRPSRTSGRSGPSARPGGPKEKPLLHDLLLAFSCCVGVRV